MPIKDPQIFVSKKTRQVFDEMKKRSEFKQMENKDLFLLAVLFGYENSSKRKLAHSDKTQSGLTRERYLSDEDNAILKAIAIDFTDDLSVIEDITKVYSIAEEYANGGIEYLKEFVFSPGTFTKKYSSKLKNKLK